MCVTMPSARRGLGPRTSAVPVVTGSASRALGSCLLARPQGRRSRSSPSSSGLGRTRHVRQRIEAAQAEELLEQSLVRRGWRRTASGPTPGSGRARAASRPPTPRRRRGCARAPAARPAGGRPRSRGTRPGPASAAASAAWRAGGAPPAGYRVSGEREPAGDLPQHHPALALGVVLTQPGERLGHLALGDFARVGHRARRRPAPPTGTAAPRRSVPARSRRALTMIGPKGSFCSHRASPAL